VRGRVRRGLIGRVPAAVQLGTSIAPHASAQASPGRLSRATLAQIGPRLDGGVQVRSEVGGGFDRRDGTLRRRQVDLEPEPRAFSGGIYDERRRGWIHPLHGSPAARRAFRPDERNRFRVVDRGPMLETWVNGVPAASLFDTTGADGQIALQLHSIAAESLAEGPPTEVRYRNLRIRRLASPP